MALALGYAVAEDWIVDSVGMRGCDPDDIRAAIDETRHPRRDVAPARH